MAFISRIPQPVGTTSVADEIAAFALLCADESGLPTQEARRPAERGEAAGAARPRGG
jgi:hypothetical protein